MSETGFPEIVLIGGIGTYTIECEGLGIFGQGMCQRATIADFCSYLLHDCLEIVFAPDDELDEHTLALKRRYLALAGKAECEPEAALKEANQADNEAATIGYLAGAERQKEIDAETLEAARYWRLLEEADAARIGVYREAWGAHPWYWQGWGDAHTMPSGGYDTRAEALDAWDKARVGEVAP